MITRFTMLNVYTTFIHAHTKQIHLNCSIHKKRPLKLKDHEKNQNSIKEKKIKQKTWYTTERNHHAKVPVFFSFFRTFNNF